MECNGPTDCEVKDDACCKAENEPLNNGKYFANEKGTKCETECSPISKWSKSDKECAVNMGLIILIVGAIFGIKMLSKK